MNGERETESSDWVVARCSTTLQSEDANNNVRESNWFEEGGRSLCFRGKTDYWQDEPWYLFILPADCLYQCFIYQQQTQNNLENNNNNNNKKKKRTSPFFNHSLRHTFPVDFLLTHEAVPKKFAELYYASWVILGSTFYFFGSTNRKIYYLNRNAADATVPASLTLKKAGRMITKRKDPKVVALDGKIYVFSSSQEHLWGEVFQPYADSFEGQSQALFPPIPSRSPCDVSFVVAIEKERQIVVGFNCTLVGKKSIRDLYPDIEETTGLSVHVYDVGKEDWEEHGNTLYLNHRTLHCQPIAVGSCLYWLDKKMRAYDLNTRQYYEGPIEDSFLQNLLEASKNPKYVASFFIYLEIFSVSLGVTGMTLVFTAQRYKLLKPLPIYKPTTSLNSTLALSPARPFVPVYHRSSNVMHWYSSLILVISWIFCAHSITCRR